MNDWIVVQTNGMPIIPGNPMPAPMSVVAVNQNNSSEVFSIQPFANFPQGAGSSDFSTATIDPQANMIFTMDSGPGQLGALRLGPTGLTPLWTVPQNTDEFLALIGPVGRRVLVATDAPGQNAASPTYQYVVWRDAATGRELARSLQLTPISSGSMVEPNYGARMDYLAANGQIIELTVRPASAHQSACAALLGSDAPLAAGADSATHLLEPTGRGQTGRETEADGFYHTYRHRAAHPAGRPGWISAMLAGMSETAIDRAFLTSPEYTGAYPDSAAGPVGPDADGLGRLPDGGLHRLAASRGGRRR
jgi:hypothetical protein